MKKRNKSAKSEKTLVNFWREILTIVPVSLVKMRASLVVAVESGMGIAKEEGGLPWPHLSGEMQYFKHITTGKGDFKNVVVMGRKTWDSIKAKPLSDRINVILTRDVEKFSKENTGVVDNPHVLCFNSFEKCFEALKKMKTIEVFFIGGGKIFAQLLDKFQDSIDSLYLTRIHQKFPSCTFFRRFETVFGQDFEYEPPSHFETSSHDITWTYELWHNKTLNVEDCSGKGFVKLWKGWPIV